MHRLAIKNSFVDVNSGTKNVDAKGSDPPVCPKPRRLGSTLQSSQFLNHSLLCSNNHQQMTCDERNEILNIIAEKRMDDTELNGCNKCLCTSYEWCGSPPRRTENPLIHDVHFLRIHSRVDAFHPYTST